MKKRTALTPYPSSPGPRGAGRAAESLHGEARPPRQRPRDSTCNDGASLALVPQRRPLERLGEQHLLGEDQVRAVVVGELVVVAHRDRVKRARDLAVAAEDAARQVDLIDRRIALAGGDAVLRRVLGGDDADAVGGARGRAQRAADALLQAHLGRIGSLPGDVLEAVQLVAPAKARVDRRLLLRVLDRDRAFGEAPEGRHQAAHGLAKRAPGATRRAGRRRARDLDHVIAGAPHQCVTTTSTDVTSALSVASGNRIFQPKLISWS